MTYRRRFGTRSRVVLYHATRRAALSAILRHGLDPSRCDDGDELEPVVFLDDNPRVAASFLPGVDGNSGRMGDGVLLAVDVAGPDALRLILDRGEFVRCAVRIPASMIRVVAMGSTQAIRWAEGQA